MKIVVLTRPLKISETEVMVGCCIILSPTKSEICGNFLLGLAAGSLIMRYTMGASGLIGMMKEREVVMDNGRRSNAHKTTTMMEMDT